MKISRIIYIFIFILHCFVVIADAQDKQNVETVDAPIEAATVVVEEVLSDEADGLAATEEEDSEDNSEESLASEKAIVDETKKELGTLDLEKVNEQRWNKTVAAKEFQYQEKKSKPVKEKSSKNIFPTINWKASTTIGKVLFYIIVALAICLILYAIFGVNFLTKSERKIVSQDVTDYEDVENFTAWESALSKAENAGDYRSAVRILYNETLQKLTQKQLIVYRKDATNSMYCQALYQTPYYKEFYKQTRIFDYVWYGEYAIDNSQYANVKIDFKNLQQQLM
jgi:hypothetical protein